MITLAEVKEHLRVEHDSEDAYIAGLELAAVNAIESWTHRYFGLAEEVTEELYSGMGDDTIWLSEVPGSAADTITVETWNGSDWDVIEAADYVIGGFGLYHVSSVWPSGRRNVRVTYQRGYAPGEEPWGIRQAVLLLVGHWYQNREVIVPGMFTQEIPLSVTALIAPYRRLRV